MKNIYQHIKNHKIAIFLMAPLGALLLVRLPLFFIQMDPDLFWHLKAGELYSKVGKVVVGNPFSFTWPNFAWVNHEWLSDWLLYQIKINLGQTAVGLWYLALFSGMLYFVFRRYSINKKNLETKIALSLIGISILLGFSGVREQSYSFLIFAFILWVFERYRNGNKRIILTLPAIGLIWANLHGGFAVGFVIGFLLLVSEWLNKRETPINLFIIGFFTLALTLVNPFGIGIYQEVFRTIGDVNLSGYISEWQSTFTLMPYQFLVYLALFLVLIVPKLKELGIYEKITTFLLLLMSLLAIKYIPYFLILSLPIILKSLDTIKLDFKVFRNQDAIITAGLILALFFGYYIFLLDSPYIQNGSFYPSRQTVEKLKSLHQTNIFNPYNWGGYLIYFNPEKKVFIDGRMPSWKQGSTSIIKEYDDIVSCKNLGLLEKYGTQIVTIPKDETYIYDPVGLYRYFGVKSGDLVTVQAGGPYPKLKECLDKTGQWQQVFSDNTTDILVRKP